MFLGAVSCLSVIKVGVIVSAGLPFWESKLLSEMSETEWESLCDGCGKCCLHKLQDEETEELLFTCISCQYLDPQSCQCSVYKNRTDYVPECLNLKPTDLEEVSEWLPQTCAYRLLHEGKGLPRWHPLLVGDVNQVHVQHISVKGKVISENEVDEDDWPDYVM
jgi:uncharacterized cysteine cluster protein YcgN (CxxCxxCC family)